MNTIKHHKTILLAIIILLSLFAYPIMAEEETTSPTCAELGYNTPVDDCISAGGIPLLCPYSNPNDKSCICQIRSCRGYPLFKEDEDYYYNTLDGGKVIAKPSEGKLEDYIDGELESCTIGYGSEALTYYRVPKCLDGFMYQNHICDKGCDLEQYPFTTHPGNLAGEVQLCKDENGDHYGYTKCNDGWVQNGANCVLNTCDIKEFPYMSDPNEDEYRGEVQTCKIGGNAYYKYTSCDTGFEKKKGVCVSKCEITDCSYTTAPEGHREWTCKLNNPKCRIGDTATYDGIDVGTIFHFPGGEDNRVHMMSTSVLTKAWYTGSAVDIPNFGTSNSGVAKQDKDGKKNTQVIMNFRISQGWEIGGANSYPAAEYCVNYGVGCAMDTVCAKGEWYLSAPQEILYVYDNRYIMFNLTNDKAYYSYLFWSSLEVSVTAWYCNGSSGSVTYGTGSTTGNRIFPTLSFTVLSE